MLCALAIGTLGAISDGNEVRAVAIAEASDDFERAARGPSWQVQIGDVEVVNGSDLGLRSGPAPPQTAIGIATWVGSRIGPDQYSEATVPGDIADEMLVQAYVRRRDSDSARYGFHYDDDPGDVPEWQIKFDGVPTAQTRILARASGPALRPGDTVRIEARGSGPVRLDGYVNGTLVLSATDGHAGAIPEGRPGVAFRFGVGTTGSFPAPAVERWRGGELAVPPAPTTTTGPAPTAGQPPTSRATPTPAPPRPDTPAPTEPSASTVPASSTSTPTAPSTSAPATGSTRRSPGGSEQAGGPADEPAASPPDGADGAPDRRLVVALAVVAISSTLAGLARHRRRV